MKFASLAVGIVAALGSGSAMAQSALSSSPSPYVPDGYQPIDYSPSAVRGTADYSAPSGAFALPETTVVEGGYLGSTTLPTVGTATGGYRVEDLQADFDANVPPAIYFDFDKSRVTEESAATLQQQAQWLQGNPEATVHLTGHADAVGANAYNYRLGLSRAKSAAAYLVGLGVENSRMKTVVSKGEEDLAISTEQRERLNRRVITRVTGVRKIPLPAPVAVVPPVKRLPPTPPPAVKEPEPLQRAQIPEYTPPPRNYPPEPPVCTIAVSAPGTAGQDLMSLQTDLESQMNAAISVYNDPNVIATNSSLFFWAHHTKAQCGLAVGYSKSGTRDERSINACKCGGQLMAHYQGAI